MAYSLVGVSIHEISQARILQWIAISFSRGFSQPRDRTLVSCNAGRSLHDASVFEKNFTQQELNVQLLEDAVASADTPEGINNGPNTAPSVRLMQAVEGYDKVVYGACLAYDIGLAKIREKCLLFNEWIQTLENY